MSRRSIRLLGVSAILVAVGFGAVVAQETRTLPLAKPLGSASGKSAAAPASNKYLVIPGLYSLNLESIRQEIGLTEDQKAKLKEISDAYQASMQRLQADAEQRQAEIKTLPREEQQKQIAELYDHATKFAQSARKKADAVLTPEQLKTLDKITFQLWVAGVLARPNAQQQIGLSEAQQKQVLGVYEKATEKMQKLQRETAEEALTILTPEQVEKLHNQMDAQKQQPQSQPQ
jgi:hypothetical protein